MANQPDKTAEEAAALQAQIASLRADMARIAALLATLDPGDGSVLDRAVRAAEAAGAGFDQASDKIEGLLGDASAYAQRKPLSALAMAGVAGLILGLLFGRR